MELQLQPSICDSPHKLALKIIFIFLSLSLLYKIEKLSKYLFTKNNHSCKILTILLSTLFTKHLILHTNFMHPRPLHTKLNFLSYTQLTIYTALTIFALNLMGIYSHKMFGQLPNNCLVFN